MKPCRSFELWKVVMVYSFVLFCEFKGLKLHPECYIYIYIYKHFPLINKLIQSETNINWNICLLHWNSTLDI